MQMSQGDCSIAVLRDEAQKTDNILRSPLWRQPKTVIIKAIEMALVAVIIPGIVTNMAWNKLWWPSLIVIVVWVIFLCIRDRLEAKKKATLVSLSLNFCEEYQALDENYVLLKTGHQDLISKFKEILKKQRAVDSAVNVLSRSLRNQVAQKIDSTVEYDEQTIRCITKITPEQIYQDIISLCEYVSVVASIISDIKIRCGVILKEPGKKNYIPIAVFDPNLRVYRSKRKFKPGMGFSEYIINEYMKVQDLPQHKNYTHMVIPDIALHNKENRIPKIELQPGQETHLKSLGGVVVYFRDKSNKTAILGAINIDSSTPGAINEETFTKFSPYLVIAYRLLADRLFLIHKNKNIFDAVRNSRLD